MSRTKARKAQRKESVKRKQVILITGLLVVVATILTLIYSQSQTNSGQTVAENGDRPVWQNAELVNSKTGETFKLADFDDKHVVVKIMSPY